jgi:hypothetical protein
MIKLHHRTVEAFQSWTEGEADGRGVPVITGLSANRLLDASDLIALHPPIDQDWLTRFVRRSFRILFVVKFTAYLESKIACLHLIHIRSYLRDKAKQI